MSALYLFKKNFGTSKFQLLLLLQYHFNNCMTMSDSFAFHHINHNAKITQFCLVFSSAVLQGTSDDFTTHPCTNLPSPPRNQETGTTIPLLSTSQEPPPNSTRAPRYTSNYTFRAHQPMTMPTASARLAPKAKSTPRARSATPANH